MTTSTAVAIGLNTDTSGGAFANYTIRLVIPAASLTAPSGTPTLTRLTMRGSAAEQTSIGAAYIGHKASSGDAYDFASTPVQIKVATSGSFILGILTDVASDDAAFVWDKTSDIVISFYIANDTGKDTIRRINAGISGSLYVKSGNDASTVNATGYAASGSNPTTLAIVSKIEMDGYTASSPILHTALNMKWLESQHTGFIAPINNALPNGEIFKVVYSLDLNAGSGIQAGDYIDACATSEVTTPDDNEQGVWSFLVLGTSDTATSGQLISPNNGGNVTPFSHHMVVTQLGEAWITDTGKHYLNYVMYADSSYASPPDVIVEGAGYGHLRYKLYRPQ